MSKLQKKELPIKIDSEKKLPIRRRHESTTKKLNFLYDGVMNKRRNKFELPTQQRREQTSKQIELPQCCRHE